jgi:hypothetical protein
LNSFYNHLLRSVWNLGVGHLLLEIYRFKVSISYEKLYLKNSIRVFCLLWDSKIWKIKELDRMFYLNWKDNCKIYKNQFKYWTFKSYLWRYDGPKKAFCAKIHHELNLNFNDFFAQNACFREAYPVFSIFLLL